MASACQKEEITFTLVLQGKPNSGFRAVRCKVHYRPDHHLPPAIRSRQTTITTVHDVLSLGTRMVSCFPEEPDPHSRA